MEDSLFASVILKQFPTASPGQWHFARIFIDESRHSLADWKDLSQAPPFTLKDMQEAIPKHREPSLPFHAQRASVHLALGVW